MTWIFATNVWDMFKALEPLTTNWSGPNLTWTTIQYNFWSSLQFTLNVLFSTLQHTSLNICSIQPNFFLYINLLWTLLLILNLILIQDCTLQGGLQRNISSEKERYSSPISPSDNLSYFSRGALVDISNILNIYGSRDEVEMLWSRLIEINL